VTRTVGFVLAAILAMASPGAAYFVIELEDGGRVEANFVREENGKLYASRATGEIEIDRARVRSVKEIEPGRRIDEVPPGARDLGGADASATGGASGIAADTLRERERSIAREMIIGHRELLFARIRGDDPEEIEKRERALEDLGERRIELREKLAPWERAR
jgi:hypothetical protein